MLRKPAWPYKLRLAPHHFQWADEYHEQGAARALSYVADDAWGINEIEWDPVAEESGRLEIRRLHATMPDGTEVTVGPDDRPLRLPMPDLGSRESVRLYIGVPAVQNSRANVNAPGDPHPDRRYVTETHTVADVANGTRPIEATWLRPNAWLLSEISRLNGFDVVPCGRLVRDEDGKLVLDRHYVPPVWRIRASTYITEQLEQLLELLRARKAWADHWQALDALKDTRRQLRGLLGTYVQKVLDLLDRPLTPPHKAYLDLVEILHTLAPFTPAGDAPLPSGSERDDDPVHLPRFHHQELGRTFSALFDALTKTLAAIGAKEHLEIRLEGVRDYPWARQADLRSPPGVLEKEFFLAVTGQDLDRLRTELPRLAKIAPLRDLLELKYANVAGVPVQWRPRPDKLPEVHGTLYFQLDKRSEIWTAICRAGRLGLQCSIPGITSIALYALDPGER
ncbi:type VI secretion system baseplate subunit TssK [Pendulispora albinea]|uniref:Type VI secretion system baseplate subunit TssK n=1 Tax=Pendulispora albinea TaxID=2741071 RepID=A0ABZ2M3A2_9BACT